MYLGVQHSGTVVDRKELNGGDDCSDSSSCVCDCCRCADHSDWFDCVHAEASCEQEKEIGGFVSRE